MSWGMIVVGGIGALVSSEAARENRETAEGIAADALEFQKEQQRKLDIQKAEYKAMKFENPFADMENVYEDLTVNQQQAQFQAQQGQQQRADVMNQMRGAAGGSGIAALAQAMANQGQLQAQQISASIGQQEAMNQRLKAQGASQIQQLERGGEEAVQQAESGRISTLLGMDYGELAGARGQVQQGFASQQSAIAMNAEMKAANRAANMQIAGDIIGAGTDILTSGMDAASSVVPV